METNKFVKKSTFILTVITLIFIFAISTFLIILYYKDKNIIVNIPTVVEDDISNNTLLNIMISE